MTNVPGPPGPYEPPYGAAPYGAAPYGPAPTPGSSTATVVTALLAGAFVLATVLAAWAVHDRGSASAASAGPARQSTRSVPGLPAAAGASSYPGLATPSLATPSLPSLSIPTPTLTPYVPPTPTATHQPLDPEAINRTFQVYMNALLYRSLSQLKSATCPKLRHTETGTALDHKYINRWKGLPYTIYNSLDYVTISATVRYVNPSTGGNGGQHTYRWYVDRYPDGHYWVCGILG